MPKPRTIFLAITHGWHARLLLKSSFLPTLLGDENLRVVILTPNAHEEYFREAFEHVHVIRKIEPQNTRILSRTDKIRRKLLFESVPSETHQIILQAMRETNPYSNWTIRILNAALSKWSLARRLVRFLDKLVLADRAYGSLFDEFKPDLLVVCSTVHNQAFHLLRRAKKESVPTFYVVESWDNPTAKMSFFEYPEKYMVWNDIMRRELMYFHGIEPEDIDVTGSAYHDIYAHPELYCPREELAQRYGMDPIAKWIVIAATAEKLYPDFDDFLERLDARRAAGAFGENCQILIRPHPQTISGYSEGHTAEDLKGIRERFPSIFYDMPPVLSQKLSVDVDASDIKRLAEILYHGDVVISFFSTTTIDACALDTPVVLPAFDDYAERTWFPTMRERLRFNHHQNVVNSGGVKIALDFDEMVKYVAAYLEDPSIDREARQRMVREQCQYLDGQSGRRMAESVLRYLDELTGQSTPQVEEASFEIESPSPRVRQHVAA